MKDIVGFDVIPVLTKPLGKHYGVVQLAQAQQRSINRLIGDINGMQSSIQQIKQRRLDMAGHDYQEKAEEFKADLKSVRERVVAFYQAQPKRLRLAIWFSVIVCSLGIAAFVKAVTPL